MQRGVMPWQRVLEALGGLAPREGVPPKERGEAEVYPAPPDLGEVGGHEWLRERLKHQGSSSRPMRDGMLEPIAPIAKAKDAVGEFAVEGAGPYFGGAMKAGVDYLVPETPVDFSAVPFSRINKVMREVPLEQVRTAQKTGFMTPNETAMALKRQNAIQAAREYRAGKIGSASDTVPYPDPKRLGAGVDMTAYQVAGEAPRAKPEAVYGPAKPRPLGDVVVKTPASYEAEDKIPGRLGIEQKLTGHGVAPETFVVDSPRSRYMVQDKADTTLLRAFNRGEIDYETYSDVIDQMKDGVRDAGFKGDLNNFDIHNENIGRMPDGSWKIIDAGHFPDDLDKRAIEAVNGPRYVSSRPRPKTFKKTLDKLSGSAPMLKGPTPTDNRVRGSKP